MRRARQYSATEQPVLQPLMYPHAVDRYRMLQLIVHTARESFPVAGEAAPGVGQKTVAYRARVGQTTVSNLENLERSLDAPKRRVSREELIKVLTWGLELEQPRLDAALWLYDGRPLNADEIRTYVRGYLPAAAPESYSARELRALVLAEMQCALDRSFNSKGSQLAKVHIFSEDARGLAEAQEHMRRMERQPGQRMNVRHDLALFTLPDESGLNRQDVQEEWARLHEILPLYGGRSIHPRDLVERYLTEPSRPGMTLERQRALLGHWVRLLEQYDLMETAFVESVPTLAVSCKSFLAATVLSSGFYRGHSEWGAGIIQFVDLPSVLRFVLSFERQWDAVPEQWRRKESVLPWLKARLNS